jgi:hypothetical protein
MEDKTMNFKLRIDDQAGSYLPGVTSGNSGVELTASELSVRLGRELELEVDLPSVARATPVSNLEPEVFLPLGVSAAVERFGRDAVAAIGSHEGLVLLDFHRDVDARTLTADAAAGDPKSGEQATIQIRHLILSLEDPEGFVQAVNDQSGGRSALESDGA